MPSKTAPNSDAMHGIDHINIIDRFLRFQNECADFFIEIAEHVKPSSPKFIAICEDQFNFMAGRSNAVVTLLKEGAYWDAQILARPIIESAVKICFLSISPEEQRSALCEEYKDVLSVINTLKQHDKARKSIDAIPNEEHPTLHALLLSNEQLENLREKYPKEQRKEVEMRWGFTRMVVTIDQHLEQLFGIRPFAALLHTYGFSSHLIHADETGLGAIRARNQLEEPRLSEITKSHSFALLDAVAGSAMICTVSLALAAQYKIQEAVLLIEKYEKAHAGTY